jgi:hypothetical protein
MPNAPAAGKSSAQTITPETAPVPVTTPSLGTVPAIVPNVPADTERKEPF